MSKPQYRDLPFNLWLLAGSVFFMRVGQFMVLPFLAIYMTQKFHSSPMMVGLVVGAGPLAFALSSINSGHLSDRFGPKAVMIVALLIGGFASLGLYLFNMVWAYLLLNIVIGIFRSAFSTASRAYIYLVVTESQRTLAYGINYIGINSGLAVGLLIGTLFAERQSNALFFYIAIIYVLLSVAIAFALPNKAVARERHQRASFKSTVNIIFRDRKLLWLMSANIIVWLAYVQMDSVLPIHMIKTFPHGVTMYAEVLMVNAILASTLQPLFSKLFYNVRFLKQIILAASLFVCGYLCYVFFSSLIWYMFGMAFITLGELIILPLIDVWIGQLANPAYPGAYYAAGNFIMFGNAFGPLIGGWVYQAYGIQVLYISCIVVSIVAIGFFKRALPQRQRG